MKFTYNVVQTVEIEIDEDMITQDFLDSFSEMMFSVSDVSDIAEYVARHKVLFDEYTCEGLPNDWWSGKVTDEYVEEA